MMIRHGFISVDEDGIWYSLSTISQIYIGSNPANKNFSINFIFKNDWKTIKRYCSYESKQEAIDALRTMFLEAK